jgi:hypothetical protein
MSHMGQQLKPRLQTFRIQETKAAFDPDPTHTNGHSMGALPGRTKHGVAPDSPLSHDERGELCPLTPSLRGALQLS